MHLKNVDMFHTEMHAGSHHSIKLMTPSKQYFIVIFYSYVYMYNCEDFAAVVCFLYSVNINTPRCTCIHIQGVQINTEAVLKVIT